MKRTRLFIFGFFLLIFSPSVWSETLEETTSNPESICSWESPMNFQASQITPTSITVTWDHPAQGAAPRGYSLTISETATGVLIDSVKVNGVEYTFAGLQMGTYYTCEIRSVCSNGGVSEHYAINTNPTIILDEIVNSLCNEPPVTSDPVGDLLNSVISNANTSDYVDWVDVNNPAQYQFYYFRVSDVNSTTKVAKFIMYREQNETNFHFKNKFGQTWVANLDTIEKTIKLFKGPTLRANVYIDQGGFTVHKTNINGSFSIKVDFAGTCTNYLGLQTLFDSDLPFNSIAKEIDLEKADDFLDWEVFPNPAFENITVKCTSQSVDINEILILNHMGTIVKLEPYSVDKHFGVTEINIDINDLSPGLYHIAINDNNRILVNKFIKI